MKNVKMLYAITMSFLICTGLAACGKESVPDETQTQTSFVGSEITAPPQASVSADIESDTDETEPDVDMETVPSLEALTENVYTTLNEQTGFEMAFSIKGFVPDEHYFTNNQGDMIEHTFTLTAMTDALHLITNTKDLNTNNTSSYEEYQTLSDNIVTTLTQDNYRWVDNTPKEMIRYDMMTKAYTSLPLIGIFSNTATGAVDEFNTCSEITRDDEGNYILTIHNWDIANYDSDFGQHGFSGLFRSTTIHDILANSSLMDKDGDCIYVFDKNYRPVSISFDIYNPNNYNADFYGIDLHGEVRFSKWNAIASIYLPKINGYDAPNETEIPSAGTGAMFTAASISVTETTVPDTDNSSTSSETPAVTAVPDSNQEFETITTTAELPIFTAASAS